MGVDSGLPDFRGDEGFWRAYPPFAKLGLRFIEMANPMWFTRDPELAWGFYGHRLELYRSTRPHAGFDVLRSWSRARPHSSFVFTSNVDGHFQRSGFADDEIDECHGSLNFLQCSRPCCDEIWPARDVVIDVDIETMRARDPLPSCPHCGCAARPNVLMFGDGGWLPDRNELQESHFMAWLQTMRDARVVIIECGAGMAVPTVRFTCERVVSMLEATLIRINPREPNVPHGHIGIAAGALETITAIDALLTGA